MKTGILITARLGSTRLPRKHLQEADGKPLLHYLLQRIALEFQSELRQGDALIVIATSDEPENRDFERFAGEQVAVFYGAASNIPLRHLQTARAHNLDLIASVDGDDILCSLAGLRKVFAALSAGSSYVKTSGLPFGMNCLGYSRDFLEKAISGHHGETLETGWGRIFDEHCVTDIAFPFKQIKVPLRFTLDYPEDLAFFRELINIFADTIYSASDANIVDAAVDGGFYSITENLVLEYWQNFRENVEKEAQNNERK